MRHTSWDSAAFTRMHRFLCWEEVIGVVSQIMTGRSQNIYVVKDVKGGEFMIPDVSEFIRKIEVEGEQAGVYVKLIDGMRG